MKLLPVTLLLAALSTACTAQQAPVAIAVEIYKSCIVGLTLNNPLPNTKSAVNTLGDNLDSFCTTWAPQWIDKERNGLNMTEQLRFIKHKNALLAVYKEELIELIPKK